MSEWSTDIEGVLENIRLNCIILQEYHKKRYYKLKSYLKYFRIPLIVLSAINSVFAVGLQPYLLQGTISIINCFISLVCGVITSVELYLKVQQQMENELTTSKDYYLLGVDIYKTLYLSVENRSQTGKVYLEEKYNEYRQLIENSSLIQKKIKDKLLFVNPPLSPGCSSGSGKIRTTSSSEGSNESIGLIV